MCSHTEKSLSLANAHGKGGSLTAKTYSPVVIHSCMLIDKRVISSAPMGGKMPVLAYVEQLVDVWE